MMMAQPFPAHQVGMTQHPGMAHGHPMPMQAPNQIGGQPPGPGMMQQMHPGVSGPGGPQATQSGPMMSGLPVVGVPNTHALQHLNSGQALMQQQQQMAQNCRWPFLYGWDASSIPQLDLCQMTLPEAPCLFVEASPDL